MLTEKAEILDEKAMARAVARISFEILERNKGVAGLCVIGILTRGAEIARLIVDKIEEVEGVRVPLGFLDITPFRDDIKKQSNCPDKSEIGFSVENQHIVLVDDVLYTARTARAAIDSVMYRGRPADIKLAVLIDRGHKEIPIRADFVGKNLPTSRDEVVKVMVRPCDTVNRVAIYTGSAE